jgi:hypothetical protein
VEITLESSRLNLDRLSRHAILAQLSAAGNTPHALAASLDGFAWIVGGQGQARRTKLCLLVGDFLTELLGAVNPSAETKQYSRMDCQGMYFQLSVLAQGLWKSWFGSGGIWEKVAGKAIEIRKERDPGAVPDLDKLIAGTQRPETE